jgi:hypothetical protein
VTGQTTGQLIGHLLQLGGALLGLFAIGRFFYVGNAPDVAVLTVCLFIYSAALGGLGKALCWFSGETA